MDEVIILYTLSILDVWLKYYSVIVLYYIVVKEDVDPHTRR